METGTGGDPDANGPRALAPGLYLVATPIGSARDITLRALDILAGADLLAAEDTRRARHLLDIHGVRRDARSLVPYHDHNGARQRPRLLAALAEGRSVALVSDAGTPLVADPGYRLAVEAIAAGHRVHAAPGASALLAALSVAGLPTDRFLFAGFAPPRQAARLRFLAGVAGVPATLVFYESPRRLAAALADMAEALGGARQAAVCRELTKRFEETRRGTLAELSAAFAAEPEPKGEIVVVIGPPAAEEVGEEALDAALDAALARLSVKDAAAEVARALGLPRRLVYARALERAE
ncbi:16S rRNA (cytidine(1402)-2'-O)-methyltransferase [Amaricoccus solimangrovi]|uniref:Ribosomal RNA small subunit methyltransferase I n=1 Tax=Amaricoccus solimangrovi TaxID=2589815 RepID=A0A501WSE4_9RHOB|nr:16S rRNA (cytidine(1402)-2'-O)-methyltransferase [Amaricoccus solimangrovi]TPE49931.1 16S rRNA (cytidine(1402)-2'-O)-methyltransferase [Amaricoccus solimangrovi]